MAEVISVGLGCKKQIKAWRTCWNVVRKQTDPFLAPGHATRLHGSLTAPLEAGLSSPPQGGWRSLRMASSQPKTEPVNCGHYSELSEGVRLVQHSEKECWKLASLSSFPLTCIPICWQSRIFHQCRRVERKILGRSSRTVTTVANAHSPGEGLQVGCGHTALKHKSVPNIDKHLSKPCYSKTETNLVREQLEESGYTRGRTAK